VAGHANVEHEVKLSMEIGADLPDLRGVVSNSFRQPDESLRAAYYDTSDLRLWSRSITLRHRTGEGLPRWTLKLPKSSSGSSLVRTELEWIGEEHRIPDQVVSAVSAIARRASLEKVAELHTERMRFLLEDRGVVWAELASDVVTVVGGRRDGMRFRQVELEMISGDSTYEDETKAVVKSLRRAGAQPDPYQKLEKALGPQGRSRELGLKSSTEQVMRRAISSSLDRLLDHDYRIRLSPHDVDPEDVHQARVATRRLRSDLGTLKSLLDPLWVRHVREDLRWIGRALGAVRDNDVLMENLKGAGASERLIFELRQERVSAVDSLLEAFEERRYMDLLDRLHAASVRAPVTDRHEASRKAHRVLPQLVNARWKKLRRDVRSAGRQPSDDQLHQIRKRSKQLRYASEMAIQVLGKAAKRTAASSESVQTLLGEYHDAVVAEQWLARSIASQSDSAASEIVFLIERVLLRKKRLGHKWLQHYARLAKPRRRKWMTPS
jgi:CHAD domain-containing protein